MLLSLARMDGPAGAVRGDRLLTLLAVAGRGRLKGDPTRDPTCGPLGKITAAADDWRRGERALAAIRLAFLPLPRFASEDEAYPLFLADAALEAGLSPRGLLGELGYHAVAALLKGAADQPRVPAGSGRASGRWTSGAGVADGDVAPDAPGVEGRSAADATRPIPVFLPSPHHGEDAVIDKPVPVRPEPPDEAVQHGHPLDLTRPGPAPLAVPVPEPAPKAEEDDKDGPACPARRDDRPRGSNPAADRYEAMIAKLVNPSDPTPKRTPETPDVTSQAYYLPQPGMDSGEVSYDDCKRTSELSNFRNLPELKKGDMVEIKGPGASFTYRYDSVGGKRPFWKQLEDQVDAITREGKGRRLFYCVGNKEDADFLTRTYGKKYENTFFRFCQPNS